MKFDQMVTDTLERILQVTLKDLDKPYATDSVIRETDGQLTFNEVGKTSKAQINTSQRIFERLK